MSIVELFQQRLSTLRRDYDAGRPQDAAIKNTELVLATGIGLELGGELVCWPTRECESVDAGEDRVFGCPLLDGLGINCRGGQMIHDTMTSAGTQSFEVETGLGSLLKASAF